MKHHLHNETNFAWGSASEKQQAVMRIAYRSGQAQASPAASLSYCPSSPSSKPDLQPRNTPRHLVQS